jgi:GNAT superfamily N-acetyltransferase
MDYRFATEQDFDLLAQWNHQLISDEGHPNPMSLPELRERMKNWIAAEYKAVIFLVDNDPVAYGLYRENQEEVYLRQLFVRRDRRRKGIGRQAVALFRRQIWPQGKRLTVDVLCNNSAAIQFWRSVGYRDYTITLEITP